jgi:hypothetical protein
LYGRAGWGFSLLITAYESPAAIAIGGTVFEYVGISEISFSLPSVGLVTSPGRNPSKKLASKTKSPGTRPGPVILLYAA